MNFEKNLKELELLVEKMEKGDLSLEDSLKSFEQGVKLSRDCQKLLSEAQQKVQQLVSVSEDGEIQTEPFEVSE